MQKPRDLFPRQLAIALVVGLALAAVAIGVSAASQPGPPPPVLSERADVAALLRGIPQHGTQLGRTDAPLTMVEYVDPQCPYCREWTMTTLPDLIHRYIRPGKLQLELRPLRFVGRDSDTATRYLQAAGKQGKLWQALELLYRNQGRENSGWVSDQFVRSWGTSIPGLDVGRWHEDATSGDVSTLITADEAEADRDGVHSTPTLLLGPTGGTLTRLKLTSLDPEGTLPAVARALKPVAK